MQLDRNDGKLPLRPDPTPKGQTPVLPPTPPSNQNFKKKKPAAAIIVLAVVILGSTAGAFFGIYLPNKPENVWKSALDNTAKGYDKIVDYTEAQKDKKGAVVKGTYKFNSGQAVVDGGLDVKYDDKSSVSNIDAGASGIRVNLDVQTIVPDNSKYPDVYVKLSGLKGIDQLLGGAQAGGLGQALATYDNQWYVIDHTLFDQLTASSSNGASSPPQLSQEDITAIAKAVGEVNNDYLFTDDKEKAVLKRNSNVGKETLDGRSVYHYKVGYDKDNLKEYINALKAELDKTKLKDYLKEDNYKQAIESIDKLSGNGEADAWVDLKTKFIRQARFSDQSKKDNYVDIGLKYTGGTEYPFYVDIVSKDDQSESKTTLGLTLNTKQNDIKFVVKTDGKNNNQPLSFNLDGTLTPSDEEVEFSKPAGAKSLIEALGPLFGGQLNVESLLQSGAGQTETGQ